jgi:hypothetical protein
MSPDRVVVFQATPEIRVRAESSPIEVGAQRDPAHIVVLAASTVAGPKGDPGDDTTELLLEHINAETPHPVYDDGPSLALLYENAKV